MCPHQHGWNGKAHLLLVGLWTEASTPYRRVLQCDCRTEQLVPGHAWMQLTDLSVSTRGFGRSLFSLDVEYFVLSGCNVVHVRVIRPKIRSGYER